MGKKSRNPAKRANSEEKSLQHKLYKKIVHDVKIAKEEIKMKVAEADIDHDITIQIGAELETVELPSSDSNNEETQVFYGPEIFISLVEINSALTHVDTIPPLLPLFDLGLTPETGAIIIHPNHREEEQYSPSEAELIAILHMIRRNGDGDEEFEIIENTAEANIVVGSSQAAITELNQAASGGGFFSSISSLIWGGSGSH